MIPNTKSYGFYKSNPKSPATISTYILEPRFNRFHELAKLHWEASNSNLYFGKIPKIFLSWPSIKETYTMWNEFKNKNPKLHDERLYQKGEEKERTDEIYQWIKLVYLTDEFIKGGLKFRSPLNAFYNPYTNQGVIHPGGQRSKIIDLFCKEKSTPCFWFDTNGVTKHDNYEGLYDELTMIPNDDIDRFFNESPDFGYGLTPHYGTFVPQIAEEMGNSWDKAVEDWYPNFESNMKNLKLKIIGDIPISKGWFKDYLVEHDKEYNVLVQFKPDESKRIVPHEISIRTQLKTMLCIMANKSYEDEFIKVECFNESNPL